MARAAATTPRKLPRQQRSQDTVAALLEATARVLIRDGYDRASTNRIAEAAGVSIGSLYQYFPSKEAIVAALIERESDAQFQLVAERLGALAEAPIPVAVRSLVEAVVECHRVHPKLHQVLTEQVPRVGALRKIAEMETKLAELLQLALHHRHNEIRPRNIPIVAFLLVHAVEGVIHGAVTFRPSLIDQGELIDELSELILRYVAK